MILLPRKIQRFIALNAIIIVLVLFIYQFTKLLIDLSTDKYVKNDYESLRNNRFNNVNFQNSKVQTDNSDTKYILSDSEFSSLFHKSMNTPLLYISRHEGTISNFKYISDYLNWNLTVFSPEVFILLRISFFFFFFIFNFQPLYVLMKKKKILLNFISQAVSNGMNYYHV